MTTPPPCANSWSEAVTFGSSRAVAAGINTSEYFRRFEAVAAVARLTLSTPMPIRWSASKHSGSTVLLPLTCG